MTRDANAVVLWTVAGQAVNTAVKMKQGGRSDRSLFAKKDNTNYEKGSKTTARQRRAPAIPLRENRRLGKSEKVSQMMCLETRDDQPTDSERESQSSGTQYQEL